MIARSLTLDCEVGVVAECLRQSVAERILDGFKRSFLNSGIKLTDGPDLGFAVRTGNDRIVGWIVGNDNTGAPAFLAIERDADVSFVIAH